MKNLLSALALLAASLGAHAQTVPAFKTTCEQGGWKSYKGLKNFCETRDLTMPAPTGQPLTVDGGPNGGITVRGWDGSDVRIRARVQAWGTTKPTPPPAPTASASPPPTPPCAPPTPKRTTTGA